MEKFKIKKINLYWQEIILILASAIYAVYFSVASFLRYDNYYTGRFDLGNMAQTVWNTAHGNIFKMTDPNGIREVSRLAFHADFILAFLSPFYLIWENPKMLLLIQTITLSMGGVFVYLISKEILKNRTLSLALSLCYFLNPAVNYVNLYDFHAVSLATTFILGAFYFFIKKNYALGIFFLILSGLTKEQVWFINSLFGLYLIFFHKKKLLGVLLFSISCFLFYYLVWIAIPSSLGSAHFALEYYSDFGDSPGNIIKNIFLNPVRTIETLLLPDRVGYIKQLFMPLSYLSFLAPIYLIFTGPDLVISLLSENPPLHQIYYQYSSTVTPFIFISAIFAIFGIKKYFPEITFNMLIPMILITTLISSYTYGPLPFAKKPNIDMFQKPLAERLVIDEMLKTIPEEALVSSSNNLGSHLSHRKNIFVVPQGIENSDFVLFLITNTTKDDEKMLLEEIKKNPNFSLIKNEGNFFMFKKVSS